jgi:hypothetical protein
MERRVKRDLQLEQERAQREAEYTKKLQDIQDEVEHQRRINKYEAEEELRKQTLEQQLADLEALKDTEQRLRQQNKLKAEAAEQAAKAKTTASARSKDEKSTAPSKETDSSSGAQADWEFSKKYEGAQSKPLDDLMEMIGLEEVKQEFLAVKSKVDTALRQRISMAGERFSCSMLGNPGTGESTVTELLHCACLCYALLLGLPVSDTLLLSSLRFRVLMILTHPRKNNCRSHVRPVPDRALRYSWFLLQGKYRGGSSKSRCLGLQNLTGRHSQPGRRCVVH